MAAKTKPKKKKPDKPQPDRFKETARAVEADESGNLFERAFRKLVPSKRFKPDSPNGA